MPADLENEVKSSASSPGNEPAVVSAPAPRPSLLKKLRGLNKVHPLVKTQLVLPKIQPVLPKIKPVLPKIQPILSKIKPVLPKIKPVLPKIKPVLPKIKPVLPKIQQVPLDTPSKHEDESLFSPFAHPHSALDQSFRLLRSDNCDHNVAVRECASRHIKALFKSMGTTGLLCCRMGDMDSFLSAICRMCQDTSQEVRNSGIKLIWLLEPNQDLNKKLWKMLP
ncbi:hypothetical protein SKAU_G00342050 [Synaphobranchus kaupii]|uniref:Uncharacterized protein n=1 Tax=Synaphobranchus kaupii TaxID=118154 RepID=A0A9Q1EN72_SYNKA|nr:hypothetical protein SKAU_G00342050 [Synaphobranchus kaupii]